MVAAFNLHMGSDVSLDSDEFEGGDFVVSFCGCMQA